MGLTACKRSCLRVLIAHGRISRLKTIETGLADRKVAGKHSAKIDARQVRYHVARVRRGAGRFADAGRGYDSYEWLGGGTMRIGLVGYGTGGRHFHAPFIAVAKDFALAGIVARAPETIARATSDLPDVEIFPTLTAMLSAGIDAVTITTPPQTREELVLEAIAAGIPVIADKPFAPNAEAGRKLDAAAKAKGVMLGVYHNRRFDADVLTLRKVLTTVVSEHCGACIPAWISTIRIRSKRDRRAAFCAISAVISSTKLCGFWVRPQRLTRSGISSSFQRG